MRIVLASSEAVPYSKTGGLGDVTAALVKALARLGHEVTLITPFYPRAASASKVELEAIGHSFSVTVGVNRVPCQVLRARTAQSGLTVLLIDQPGCFDRGGLYRHGDVDYADNCARFCFFSRAVMETARRMELRPHVIHANDWQTGLIPPLLQLEYSRQPSFSETASVFTIHNLAFQGNFPHWDMALTGLGWKHFNWEEMEFFGQLSLLKSGIVFANVLTTVSPTYACEIQTPESGCGMDGVLRSRSEHLVGILNGIDAELWDPATDPALPQHYDAQSVGQGKMACKATLRRHVGLGGNGDEPLFGMVSRMTDQKGFDLISECGDEACRLDLQMVFLGTGEAKYERLLKELAGRYPEKVAVVVGFDDQLAHQIEAGSDAYLMPSRYEPCGLNQMYSLRYGTVPVVRAVGGLADTVLDATPENVHTRRANGFSFREYTADALCEKLRAAVAAYRNQELWSQLVQNGMRQDWSWDRSALEYVKVYERALRERGVTPP